MHCVRILARYEAKMRPPRYKNLNKSMFRFLKYVVVIKLSGKMYERGLIFASYLASILKACVIATGGIARHARYIFTK